MCMNFSISKKECGALLAFCIIFSPVILVGAIGYGVTKGVHSGVSKGITASKKVSEEKDHRKVNSVLMKQRRQAMNAVGEEAFQAYLQGIFDRSKKDPSFAAQIEFAAALFMNNDILTAVDIMAEAFSKATPTPPNEALGPAHYLYGTMLQQLRQFERAGQEFRAAAVALEACGATVDFVADVPRITVADAYAAQGSMCYFAALYGRGEDNSERNETLQTAQLIEALGMFEKAISAVPPRPNLYHSRALARYFLAVQASNRSMVDGTSVVHDTTLLTLAIADWDAALASDDFEDAATALAFKGQSLTLLGQGDAAEVCSNKAHDLDPFLYHLNDLSLLDRPWPLPPPIFTAEEEGHDFEEKFFKIPTWCDHCMKFVTLAQSRAKCFQCRRCSMNVHRECLAGLQHNKACWAAVREPVEVGAKVVPNSKATKYTNKAESVITGVDGYRAHVKYKDGTLDHLPIEWLHVIERPAASTAATLGHVHRLKDKVLHRPHWCDACGKFIVGVHAYRCAECPLLIHKECVKAVGNAVVDI